MRRFIIILVLLAILTSCRYQDFSYGTPVVESSDDYSTLINTIIEEGKYEDNVVGPYNRFHLIVDYNNGTTTVSNLNVSSYRSYDDEETTYDSTVCFDEEGVLKCGEHKSVVEGHRILPEIEFRYAFEQFSKVDLASMVHEIKTHYEIGYTTKIWAHYKFVLPEDIEVQNDYYEDVLFYYDNQYHYDESYESPDMMLKITIYFQDSNGGFAYGIYKEIDE